MATPPPSQLVPCATPVSFPPQDLTEEQIEIYWGRDRTALRECGSRHDALARPHREDEQ